MNISIPVTLARQILLDSQGLRAPRPQWNAKAGAQRAIEHLGYVQIDTINIVERAHHHILFNRVKDYEPAHLHTLLEKDRSVFEYWTHALSYVPVRDYRYFLPFMAEVRTGAMGWYNPRPTAWIKKVLARIEKEGPLGVSDFEERVRKKKHLWAGVKVAKRVLERLKFEGALTVVARRGFEKVYDLTSRVHPHVSTLEMPSKEEVFAYRAERAARTFGIFTAENALHLHRKKAQLEFTHYLAKNQRALGIREARIEGSNAVRWISERWLEPGAIREMEPRARILSPFDPVLIQRKLLKDVFHWDYTIECYVPAPKRKYGYFCLPILWGDRFVGRMDCKAYREEGMLEVTRLHQEASVEDHEEFGRAVRTELEAFARFNRCPHGYRIKRRVHHSGSGKRWLNQI